MDGAFPWRRLWRAPAARFSLLMLAAFSLTAILTPWLAPHDPYRNHVRAANLPPMWVTTGSRPGQAQYPLGTDRLGRDVLSRLLYGLRTAVALALTAVPLAAGLGTLSGLTAGYLGGRAAAVQVWVWDVLQALPGIMFLVMTVYLARGWLTPSWGAGLLTLVVGFAAVSWVSLARLVRVSVAQIAALPFVEAAVSLGASPAWIIGRHLLPNVQHVILVWIINHIPAVIMLEAVLGYIGVGVTAAVDGDEFTVVSWGGMFFSGRSALNRNPLMLALPALGVLLLSVSFVFLSDQLRALSQPEPE